MIKFTVQWDASLERSFVSTWVDSDSETRELLTEIANWIDSNLAIDPHLLGQDAMESVRIVPIPVTAARVSIAFQVLQEDRQVRILRMTIRK